MVLLCQGLMSTLERRRDHDARWSDLSQSGGSIPARGRTRSGAPWQHLARLVDRDVVDPPVASPRTVATWL